MARSTNTAQIDLCLGNVARELQGLGGRRRAGNLSCQELDFLEQDRVAINRYAQGMAQRIAGRTSAARLAFRTGAGARGCAVSPGTPTLATRQRPGGSAVAGQCASVARNQSRLYRQEVKQHP